VPRQHRAPPGRDAAGQPLEHETHRRRDVQRAGHAEPRRRLGRLEIRQGDHRNALALEQRRRQRFPQPPEQVEPGAGENARSVADARRAVVVAADREDRHAETEDQLGERVVEQPHRLGRRQGSVIDVPGDHHQIRAQRPDEREKLPLDELPLLFEQRHLQQRPAQVPVGGVQDPQGTKRRRAHASVRALASFISSKRARRRAARSRDAQ
jgi:hypothetical protein